MPNHAEHELEALLVGPILIAGAWWLFGSPICWVFGGAFVWATIFFSPDLDQHHSAPAKRWWLLSTIWAWYAARVPHRSWVSHWPVMGTCSRLFWLTVVFSPLIFAALAFRPSTVGVVVGWYWAYEYEVWAGLAGLEASALLHISLDAVW